MAHVPLRVAALIVSTTASENPSSDKSEPVLREVIEQEGRGRWDFVEAKIVSDHVPHIQRQIMLWADIGIDAVDLVLTTGGTGFAVSDHTPEAVGALLHKAAPGLVHAMLASSLEVTPFAMMSRPVAGVRNNTVIVTLPGSPKGAKENLQAILKTLPHACVQAKGGDSRALHSGGVKKLEADAGVKASGSKPGGNHSHSHPHDHHHHHHYHSHGHGHGHGGGLVRHTKPNDDANPLSNDPSLGPTRRHRESPYPMIPVDEALHLIQAHTPCPVVVTSKIDAFSSSINAVLAEDVTAAENVPGFRASIVDGYAVVVPPGGDMRSIFHVTAVSHAASGGGKMETLKAGEVARITTGAPLPPGATAVIMVEDTVLKSMKVSKVTAPALAPRDNGDGEEESDAGTEEEDQVEILADGVKEGENIREAGSDVRKDDVILRKGEQVSGVGGEIGLLSSVGVAEVKTYRRPIVGILSTGDELVEVSSSSAAAAPPPYSSSSPQQRPPGALRPGEVRDSNRAALAAAARQQGFDTLDLGIARDQPRGALEAALRDGLRAADAIITTGGVSMGELDLLKPTVERSLGGTIHFGRVDMKPGKPTTFATVPVKTTATTGHEEAAAEEAARTRRVDKPVFALPGNPASALVTFHLFVLPALHKMAGIAEDAVGLPRVPVTLAHDFPLDKGRPEYHRAVVSVGKDGVLNAASTGGQRSSRVGSLRSANALLCMPKGAEPLKKGAKVDALLMSNVRAEP